MGSKRGVNIMLGLLDMSLLSLVLGFLSLICLPLILTLVIGFTLVDFLGLTGFISMCFLLIFFIIVSLIIAIIIY